MRTAVGLPGVAGLLVRSVTPDAPAGAQPTLSRSTGIGKPARPSFRHTHLTYRLAHGPGQLRRLIARLARPRLPTVLGGDLNMCRPTIALAAPYRPLVRGRTWPAHRPVAQLDHLLAGPGVTVGASAVAAEQGSDHRAVRATVTLTPYSVRPEQRAAVV